MQKTIYIKKIFLPKKSLFQEFILDLTDQVNVLTGRKYTPKTSTHKSRLFAAKLVIEGLYRCYCSQSKGIGLAVPHNPNAYKDGDENKIGDVGYKVILPVIDSMVALGWVKRKPGRWTGEDTGETTELRASGALLEEFKRVGLAYQELEPIDDVLVLRNYDEKTKRKYNQPLPKSDPVRKMGANLRRINKSLCKQCICLMISNENFKNLGHEMTFGQKNTLYDFNYQGKFPRYIDFSMIQLRRIFSRDSMKQGGRFYGGWWQFIPKKYRVHITINRLATVEVDYSGLHPMMLYHLSGLEPPDGDMYDIGIWKTAKEREHKRPIVKEFFNAIVNDEFGVYKMSKESRQILGLSNSQLRKKIAERHPLIADKFNSGYGLTLQYEDSKIAERVMLLLLEQEITCLPVHDSFIVQSGHRTKLVAAMNQAYKEQFGVEISHKSTFLYEVDEAGQRKYAPELPMPFLMSQPGDEIVHMDREALYKMHEESLHNQYCNSWRLNC